MFNGFFSDIDEMCELTDEAEDELSPISAEDFQRSLNKMRSSRVSDISAAALMSLDH